jgi:biopolymer transport protein ExbD
MTWKIRHEGSPRALEGLTLPQVVEGLQDGLWEPTDEVMGPQDPQWVAIENHPQLAEVAEDLEPPPPRHQDDETRLDMNPLIDVCLVLLIFFMLTTTYVALQKILDMPSSSPEGPKGKLTVVSPEKVKEVMIKVEARRQGEKTVIRVEDRVVEENNLLGALRGFVSETRKTDLLLDADDGVDWGTVVAIQDAAKGAGIQRVNFAVQPPQ